MKKLIALILLVFSISAQAHDWWIAPAIIGGAAVLSSTFVSPPLPPAPVYVPVPVQQPYPVYIPQYTPQFVEMYDPYCLCYHPVQVR